MDCKQVRADGQICKAIAMKGSDFCFSHNPDTQAEKHLAVVKGGENSRKLSLNLKPLSIKSPQEISSLLEDTINGVRSGDIPPNIANTIGFLAGHALKAIETGELKEKIIELHAVVVKR